MSAILPLEDRSESSVQTEDIGGSLLRQLVESQPRGVRAATVPSHPVVGTLVALDLDGHTALVTAPLHFETALRARSVVNLSAADIGGSVVLMFDNGQPERPLVMGVLKDRDGWPLAQAPGQVEVHADGSRMTVSATDELVLRCGKASITLTKAGKVVVRGTHVASHSDGVNRLTGGSVQLN